MNEIAEATRENFDELVSQPGLTLVDVWGPQCAPCLSLMPHVEELPSRYPELRIVKLEAPKARRVCIDHRVMGLPTFLLFEDGKEISRLSDPQLSADKLDEWLAAEVGSRLGGASTS